MSAQCIEINHNCFPTYSIHNPLSTSLDTRLYNLCGNNVGFFGYHSVTSVGEITLPSEGDSNKILISCIPSALFTAQEWSVHTRGAKFERSKQIKNKWICFISAVLVLFLAWVLACPSSRRKEAVLADTRVLCLTVLLVCLITEIVVGQTDKLDYDASDKTTRLKQWR